jgi:hypothetical protein
MTSKSIPARRGLWSLLAALSRRSAISALCLPLVACGSSTATPSGTDAASDAQGALGVAPSDGAGSESEASDGGMDAGSGDDVADARSNMVPDVGIPPLDGGELLRNLTMAELSALCDWENGAWGGYGRISRGGCHGNDPTNAACVQALARYYPVLCDQTATVADRVACVSAALALLPSCDTPAECAIFSAICVDASAGGPDSGDDSSVDSGGGE